MRNLFIKFLPIIILAGTVLLFFMPQLVTGKLPIPADTLVGLYHPWRDTELQGYNMGKYPFKNPLITDPVLQTYPWRKTVIDNIKNFQTPLWNPYSFSGQPLLANIQSAALQPMNLLFLILPFNIAWVAQMMLGSVLTSLFMYIFLRSLNLQKIPSLYGAIALPFTGFFIAWLTWGTVNLTASVLPLILWCINKITNKLTPLYFLILTIAFTTAFFSGHSQTAIYIIFTALFFALFKAIFQKKLWLFIVVFLSLGLSLIIASPQLLPAFEFLKYSNRASDQLYFPKKEDWFIPVRHLIQIIAPDFFGNPTRGNYWGVWNYGEFVSFIGITPLFFALLAILKTNKKTVFFVVLTAIALLLAVKNPVSQLPYNLNLPIVSSMQPSRIILILNFGLVVLSSFGLEQFLAKKQVRSWLAAVSILLVPLLILICFAYVAPDIFPKIQNINASQVATRNLIIPITTVIFASILAILSFKNIKTNITITLIFLLTICELFYFAYKYTPFTPRGIIFPGTKIIDYLSKQQKPFRVMSTDRRIASPNSLTPYRIETVSGYDPLYLKKYGQLAQTWQSNKVGEKTGSFNRFITPENYHSNITNLLNVQYILTFNDINNQQFEKIIQEGETKLYKNNSVLPRVYFVTEIEKTQSPDETLEKLLTSKDLKNIAYSQDFSFQNGDPDAKAQILNYSDQSIKIGVSTKQSTPLIISNIYYPGWKAYIDGEEETINEVDYLLQAVTIPKGEHTVFITFSQGIFYQSLIISLAGVAILVMFALVIWKKSA